jgi:hypothetical protein
MSNARLCLTCVTALIAFAITPAKADADPGPGALDGLAVAHAVTPAPTRYFDMVQSAASLTEAGKFKDAEPLVDRSIAEYPIDGHNWLLAGAVKRGLGKYVDAANDYRRAMDLLGPGAPGNAEYWLAVCEAAAGHDDRALDALDHLVAQDHYGGRPSLYDDDAFRTLRASPRFLQIAGRIDPTSWSRDEGWRHDIDYLVAEVRRVNPDYHDRPLPDAFEALHAKLLADVPRLSDEQIYVGMSRMLASLHQGHTALWPFIPADKIAFKALPVQLYVFPEGIFIVGATPQYRDLIGAELVKIEDTPALDALRQVSEVSAADSGMEVVWLGVLNLSVAQELKGLGIARRTDEIAITVRTAGGATVTRTLTTTPIPMGMPKLHAAPGFAPPLAFRDVDRAHWFEPLPEAAAMYVQVNQIADDPDETLQAFGVRLRTALKDPRIRNVILDLRHDNGGNTFDYVELLRTLTAFSQGDGRKLYVIIGRGVYSAAGNLVTDLDRLASPTFIGEPTNMTGNNYGDESQLRLPYSGVFAGITSLKWQLGYPSDGRRAIVPQVPVALTAGDYFAGRDPVLQTAIALCVRQQGKRD